MIRETVKLMPGRDEVYLDYYGNDDRSEVADAMLVIPGGGYGAVCADREGEPIALSYLTKGINAFVLHYSVGSEINDPLDPLTEASLAMLHIRANAQKYNIDPARVFAVGFSAGGHLAGSLGTLWNDAELQAHLPEAGEDAGTIEDVYEPYLMQLGFVMRTPRGRILTPAAYEHMKLPMPQEDGDDRQLRFDFDDEE